MFKWLTPSKGHERKEPEPVNKLPKVDVIGQADIIVPKLEALVKFNIENSDRLHKLKCNGGIDAHEQIERGYRELVEASRALVTEVWGKPPAGGKEHSAEYRELEGHNVLSHSTDANIVGCVVYGWNPLSNSIRPNVRDSFVLGHNAISGSGFVSHHSTVEEYATFVELEPHILSYLRLPEMKRRLNIATNARANLELESENSGRKRKKEALNVEIERLTQEITFVSERFLRTLHEFSKVIPESKYELTNRWFRETRPDIERASFGVVADAYRSLPKNKQKEVEHIMRDLKLAVAAHELESMLHNLSFFGDTYHIDIANSIVFGWNAGSEIKGGIISNSIFAGYLPLNGANVRIWNSYLITPKGTRYIREEVLGNPQTYQTIPESVQKRGLNLRDLHQREMIERD